MEPQESEFTIAVAIDQLLDDGRVHRLVEIYLGEPDRYLGRQHCYGFGGATFTRLARSPAPGYPDPDPDRWLYADALALTLLDEHLTAGALRGLGDAGKGVAHETLAAVPLAIDLWHASDDDLKNATEAWRALCRLPGVGSVQAGKLLARKRPRLVPVYDSIVKSYFGLRRDHSYWELLRAALVDHERRDRIDGLRPPGFDDVTTLRLIDIAIWMTRSGSTQAKHARRDVGRLYPPRQ